MLLLPLHFGREALATLIFIGGLSAATSMVIVSTIALSTMVSNHIVAPLALRLLAAQGVERSGDVKRMLLATRRVAMVLILGLGYVYFRASGRSDALAATGLIAFCGVAQFLPALIAGIFWRNATRAGAIAGLVAGFVALVPTPSTCRASAAPSCSAGRDHRPRPLRHRRAAPARALRRRRRRTPSSTPPPGASAPTPRCWSPSRSAPA